MCGRDRRNIGGIAMKRHEIKNMEDALEYYRKRQQEADRNYQETGQRRYANDEYLNGLLVNALEKALDKKDAVEIAKEKRSKDIYEYIERRLVKETYTKDEVTRILKQMAWW